MATSIFSPSSHLHPRGLVLREHAHALALEALLHERRHLGVFAHQHARQHLDLRDLTAQARERLRQLASRSGRRPSTTSRSGSSRRSQTVSEVR